MSNIIWKPNQNDDFDMGVKELIDKGFLRQCGFENGEPVFELTEQGKKESAALLARIK